MITTDSLKVLLDIAELRHTTIDDEILVPFNGHTASVCLDEDGDIKVTAVTELGDHDVEAALAGANAAHMRSISARSVVRTIDGSTVLTYGPDYIPAGYPARVCADLLNRLVRSAAAHSRLTRDLLSVDVPDTARAAL